MFKKGLLTTALLFALILSLAACSEKKETITDNTPITGSDITLDNDIRADNETVAKTPEEEIDLAESEAQRLLSSPDSEVGKDMGSFVKRLGGYIFEGVKYKDKTARVIQLFWQCKDSKATDYSAVFTKEQWSVQMFYDGNEFLGLEVTPCEYSLVTAALASIKLMGNKEGEKLLYDTYIDDDYSSVVSKEDYRQRWDELTGRLGSFSQVKSLFLGYNNSYTYPYVTVLLEFEKGSAIQSYYYKPGTVKAFNIITTDYNENQLVTVTAVAAPSTYTADPEWLATLDEFADSPFDLTAALSSPSLKDLCADYFKLGAAIYGSGISNCAINSPEYMIVLKKHFNSTTLTNLMKPVYVLNQTQSMQNAAQGIEDPVLNFDNCIDTLQWCMDNGVKLRGHTLVWHTQTPDWFFREGYKNDGALVDRETMLYRLESFIRQYLTFVQDNYPGVVYCWDVVNEAVEPSAAGDPNSFFYCRTAHGDGEQNLWYKVLGQDYVEMAFTYARKYAAEGVALFYNDYNAYDPKKADNIYKLCEYLNSKGLIDGIGMQGYWGISYPGLGTIASAINKYAELGLEIQITELSIGVDNNTAAGYEAQGVRYASVMRLLQSLDTAGGGKANITAVTFFGLMDGFMLYTNDTNTSRLFDSGLQPKPAFNYILETFEMFY